MIASRKITSAAALLALVFACNSRVITPDWYDQYNPHTEKKSGKVFEVIWRIGLVSKEIFSEKFQNRSTPQISSDGKLLIVGTSDGSISCLNAQDGTLRWKFRTEGPSDVSALVDKGKVFFVGGDSYIYALRLIDGKPLWKRQLSRPSAVKPVLDGKALFIMTDDDELVCLDAATGEWQWSYKQQEPSTERFRVAGGSRPAVLKGFIYASFSDGTIVKLATKDGSISGKRVLRAERDRFWDADVDVVITGDMLIAGSFGQGLFALSLEDLSQKWHVVVEGPSDVSISGDLIFTSTADAEIVAISIKEGKIIWKQKIEKGGLLSAPIVTGNWLLVSSEEQSLLALDKESGQIMQKFDPGKGSSAAPSVFRNKAWWISNGETLYAMAVNN